MRLNKLQKQFWNGVRSTAVDSQCIEIIADSEPIERKARLGIYRNTMLTAHTNALAQTFSCCEKILGKKYFKQVCKQYFYEHPASSQNLNIYGKHFPEFLLNLIKIRDELFDYLYLPDLAKLELAYERAYYAKEDPKFDFDYLSKLNEAHQNSICFTLNSSVYLLKSDYPIYEVWSGNQNNQQTDSIEAIDEPQYLCISRTELTQTINKINFTYYWLMQQLNHHYSFSEICSLEETENLNIPLQTIIPDLITKNWVTSCYLKESSA